jgi:succinyl-CoA synthetase beta subunit
VKEVRAMANEQNLKPVRTTSEARKRGKAGGIRSGQVRAERKTLKEELLLLLSEGNTQNKLSLALIEKAMNGDTKAFEVIRDTIGEKPTDKIEQSGELNNMITVKLAGDIEEWGK